MTNVSLEGKDMLILTIFNTVSLSELPLVVVLQSSIVWIPLTLHVSQERVGKVDSGQA